MTFCWLIGHRWAMRVIERERTVRYVKTCTRCGVVEATREKESTK